MIGPVTEALILGAGIGDRLGDLGRERPKGFLRLGGRPIVEESIERLASVGITRVVIVTGYRADDYQSLAAASDGLVDTIHNPSFAESGSLQSLCIGAEAVASDLLLLESDLIYETRALQTLLDGPEDAILLSGLTGAGDEVFVETHGDGTLRAMSKSRDALGDVAGELVGICRLSRDTLDRLTRIGQSCSPAEYEVDGLVAVGAEKALACRLIDDLLWAEIDDADQLRRARDEIYPRLRSTVGSS
jgi:2-aminoethylphosphonate-pyruvate transaminase